MSYTTDLNIVRERPNLFVWGKITNLLDIGEYTIAEYVTDDSLTQFFGWADGKHFSESWSSFDEALVGLVARKRNDQRADSYFFKMIGG